MFDLQLIITQISIIFRTLLMKIIYTTLVFFFCFFTTNTKAQTLCSGGSAAGYPCSNVDLMAVMSNNALGGGNSNDIWGWTDPTSGNEYAILGKTTGTVFVDVTNPSNPVYLGRLPTHTSNSSWRDIKVYNNHAYIVSEAGGHGIQVFDLTQLANVTNPPQTFSNSGHYGSLGNGNSHNIAINESTGYAYSIGTNSQCSGGPVFFDLSDPTNLSFDGCFSSDGYTHDAVIFTYLGPDTDYTGKEICIASNEDTQTIIDVTDKANPSQISRTAYSGSRYSHQGWITDDHIYLLFDDELDESNNGHNTRTHIWDISDLDNPVNLGFHDASVAAIDHNQYVKGRYTYQANYRAGLRILDVDDVANGNLNEVAYFDVYPSGNSANFNGAWSVYPYFKSGTVIVSSIEGGLFVLRPNVAHFVMESNDLMQIACEGDPVIFDIDLTAYSGFSDLVNLSVSGLPNGATASFTADPVSPGSSSILTISGTAGNVGTYSLLLRGENLSGTTTHDLSIAYRVEPVPIAAGLNTPANNSVAIPTTSTVFSWSPFPSAVTHTIQIATDPAFSNIVQSSANISGTSYVVMAPLAEGVQHYWRVIGVNSCGQTNSSTFTFETVGVAAVLIQPKVFLGGNLNPFIGLMKDNLRSQFILPTNHPYGGAPWFHTGTESVPSSIFMTTGNDAIIDWVLVDIRTAGNQSTVFSTRACLLQADGDVVDLDGISPVAFEAPADEYYVTIQHRNHLAVNSQNTFGLSSTPNYDADFTSIPTLGVDAQELLFGVAAMWSGDTNSDSFIDASDRSSVWNGRNVNGYLTNDVDMNGTVDAADRSTCWNHRNLSANTP